MVEPGVLLEVLDLVGDLALGIGAGGAQAGDDVGGGLVGVDLVADQQQGVGPVVVRRVRHLAGERDEGVGAELGEVLVVERVRSAATAEREAERITRVDRADHAGRERGVRQRPHGAAVQRHLVGVRGARPQVVEPEQGVVVAVDAPRVGGGHVDRR